MSDGDGYSQGGDGNYLYPILSAPPEEGRQKYLAEKIEGMTLFQDCEEIATWMIKMLLSFVWFSAFE